MNGTTDGVGETKHLVAYQPDWRALKCLGALHDTSIAAVLSEIIDAALPNLSAESRAIIRQARSRSVTS